MSQVRYNHGAMSIYKSKIAYLPSKLKKGRQNKDGNKGKIKQVNRAEYRIRASKKKEGVCIGRPSR